MMKIGKTWTLAAAACVLATSVIGCKKDNDMSDSGMSKQQMKDSSGKMSDGMSDDMSVGKTKMMMTNQDIIQVATGANMGNVTTLVKAIQAADLVDTLKGKGPFTVFAPTNAAFDKLPPGTVENLLKPENKAKLRKILLYHVHSGDAIMAADVKTMSLSTAEGSPLSVKKTDSGVMVDGAKVVKANVMASNGVIHQIDTVLMPPDVQ